MKELHEARLLIVDDEPELLAMLEGLLSKDGFRHIACAGSVCAALKEAARFLPDAMLLDVMLPDGDGFELLKKLRRFTDVPVLFLSARDEDEARLQGLGLGADDYITKPFLPMELILRLHGVIRRTYRLAAREESPLIRLGSVTVDMSSGAISGNGDEKTLTAKEYALLKKLNQNRGQIVSLDSLCMAAWNDQNIGYDNTLMVHMHRLREKIEPDPAHPRWLITVRGLGYRLLKEEGA